MDTQRFELNSPNVIGEVIDGEVMIIDLVGGTYFSLAGTGAAVWPLLSTGVPTAAIIDAVARSCGVESATVAKELAVFVDALRVESILRPADPKAELNAAPNVTSVAAVPSLPEASYTGFAVARYDDMRALLVVDPVHEVGDFGWPQTLRTPPPRDA